MHPASAYTNKIKRINVFEQSLSNPNDLTARTFPATDTCAIVNSADISNPFDGIPEDQFKISVPYLDELTT